MFRDTFAVEALLAGVQIHDVSVLLGHTRVANTERHYLPWFWLDRNPHPDNNISRIKGAGCLVELFAL